MKSVFLILSFSAMLGGTRATANPIQVENAKPGTRAWQLSNPPILQLAALRASMELFDRAGMPALRRKGDRLTAYLEWLLRRCGAEVLTPRERASMLTVRFRKPGLVPALARRGAIVDLRPPDIVRITPAPLYNSFEDVQRLGALIAELHEA